MEGQESKRSGLKGKKGRMDPQFDVDQKKLRMREKDDDCTFFWSRSVRWWFAPKKEKKKIGRSKPKALAGWLFKPVRGAVSGDGEESLKWNKWPGMGKRVMGNAECGMGNGELGRSTEYNKLRASIDSKLIPGLQSNGKW